MTRRWPLLAFALLGAWTPLAARAAPPDGAAGRADGADVIALVGGDVDPVSGPLISGGTVLIRGEKIAAVGKDVAVPPNARRIDCRGARVTPGLIESDSSIGLVEIPAEPTTVDNAPRLPFPVRAAVSVADAVDVRSTLVGVARRHGVTAAVSVPTGGLIAGRSAWVDLVGPRSRFIDRAVEGPLAMHAALNEAGTQLAGGSRATAVALLREVLDDARVFEARRDAFERNALYHLAASRLDFAALQPVLARKMRLVIAASRAADIRLALALARAEHLEIAIIGAEEGWIVAEELARARVPVIVQPMADLPDAFETRNVRADNVARLARAGVSVAVAVRASHQTSNLRFLLGNAVRLGLPPAEALRAGTLVPAQIFGMEKRYGSIEPGKVASLVVWTGDPFEPSSFARTVLIRGEVQPVESRQTALSRRYIRRHRLKPT